MPSARVTLSQVAQLAKVSPATASFVMSERADMRISPETEERVRAAAAKLGYRPNLTARSLRTGTFGTIAFVSDLISSTPFAGAAVRGALEATRAGGALMFMGETLGDPEVEQRVLEGLIDRGVDGFIYAAMSTRKVALPSALQGVPVVLLNCEDPGAPEVSCVLPDERAAGAAAASLLLEAQHADGIYLLGATNPRQMPWALRERRDGVVARLRSEGVRLEGSLRADEWEPAAGRTAVAELLDVGTVPRALICMNDRLAFGAYQALASHKISVPDQVSVVSFDDTSLAGWLQPSLTSIALPHYELGRLAIELLQSRDLMSGPHRVPMPVQDRESIAPPRR